jgi:predicted phage tail protein
MSENKQIHIVRLTNPFDPREHTRETLAWEPGKTLADYCTNHILALEHVFSVNGRIVEAGELANVPVSPDDYIVACPIPQGGGGNKSIFRIVALIAVSMVAPYAAAALNGVGGLATGTVGALTGIGTAISAGVSLAGSMLINALLPPAKPKAGAAGSTSLDSSPTYGIDGAKNTSAEGVVVPVAYGTFRMGGNIISNYIVNEGNTQILYMLINAGEGPISGISEIELNDQPLSSFSDYEVQYRLGEHDQELINWFDDTIDPHSVNLTLTTSWTTYTTSGEVDKFRIDVVAPGGLFTIDPATGVTSAASVALEIEYRVAGSGGAFTPVYDSQYVSSYTETVTWGELPVYDGEGNLTGYTPYVPNLSEQLIGDEYYSELSNGDVVVVGSVTRTPVYSQAVILDGKSRSAIRRSITSPVLEEEIYEIRIRRTTAQSVSEYLSDAVAITDVNEIVTDDVQLNNTALVALKIRLNDQLNGLPKVTFLNHGRIIRYFDVVDNTWKAGASNNPAWVTLDILTHPRYGGGLAWSRFDTAKFTDMAVYNHEQGLAFNGIFDTSLNIWDAAQTVMRCGHSQLVNVGTRYTVAIEKEDDPVMMFSVANIIQGSFKEDWLGVQDRANEIEVNFFDKEDKYRQKPLRIVDEAAISAGSVARSASVTLFGVTNAERAYKDGLMLLNMNRYILQTVSFSAPLEAIACTVGDLIYVQHDMPQWGYAGRLLAGSSTTAILLDRDVTMESGKNYRLLLLYNNVMRASGAVSAITGTAGRYYVLLGSYTGTTPVKRLVVEGVEHEVLDVFESGGNYGVIIDDASAMSVSDDYELYDVDAIEERAVTTVPGTGNGLIATSAFPSAPAQYMQWMFGEVDKVKKPFRVKSISGSHEYRRDIVAVEYNATVYDMDDAVVPTINYSDLDQSISHVTITEVTENVIKAGVKDQHAVTVHFTSGQEIYRRSRVQVSINGGAYEEADFGIDHVTVFAERNAVLKFRVMARSVTGQEAPESTAPTITYTVLGLMPVTLEVPPVTGLAVEALVPESTEFMGKDARFSWRVNSITEFFEFGEETYGADAGTHDPHFAEYIVKIYDTSENLLRTESVQDASYVYTFEKNVQDGLRRMFVVKVNMVDTYNNAGPVSTLTVSNVSPAAPTDVIATGGFRSVRVRYTKPADTDFAGVRLWMHTAPGFTPSNLNLVYEGPDSEITVSGLASDTTYYFVLASGDTFGWDTYNSTAEFSATTSQLTEADVVAGSFTIASLDEVLATRIGLVDADAATVGSVNYRIGLEASARTAALLDEADARNDGIATETTNRIAAINNEAADRAAAILVEAAARESADGTLQSQIDLLAASSGGDLEDLIAAVEAESTARIAGDAAEASARTTLATQMRGAYTGTDITLVTAGLVYEERQARAAADGSISSTVSALSSTVTNNLSAVNASIASESSTRASADLALSSSITSLTGTVNNNTAAITTEQNTRASADIALSNQISVLTSSVNANGAAIVSEALTRANADSSLSSQISALTATSGSNTAAIAAEAVTRASVDGSLLAQYTVKVDVNGYVAGYGLASTATTGTPTSEMIFLVDKFKVVHPGYASITPFYISGGITYMNGAYIDSLNGNKIVADTINVNHLTANSVTTSKINSSAVTTEKVGSNAVTAVSAVGATTDQAISTYADILGIGFTTTGGPLVVSAFVRADQWVLGAPPTGTNNYKVSLLADSTTLAEITDLTGFEVTSVPIQAVTTLAAGTYTFYLRVERLAGSDVNIKARALSITELKR